MKLDGGRVLITGGSSGIGLEVAHRLVKAGASVGVVGRRRDTLEAVAAQLGPRAWTVSADLAEIGAVDAVAQETLRRWDGLDGMVTCAGVAPMATLNDTEPQVWDHAFAVNVRAPYLLGRALHPALAACEGASVVHISSTLAEKPIPGMAAYNASKAALNQLTRSAALEWAPRVRVNAIMPAVVDTPIHATRGLTPEQVRAMGRIHPLKRIGAPADVAAAVLFLLSDEASWMTGTVIPVDGGMMVT